jgi:hypothetical protein
LVPLELFAAPSESRFGEAIHVQGAVNEAALRGSREELEWNQETDPGMQVDVVAYRHKILSIRSPIIESAGEPSFSVARQDGGTPAYEKAG